MHDPEADGAGPAAASRTAPLREAVLGGIDGTVTTFAIVAGVAGAGLPVAAILVLGLANVLADGFSMAAGIYAGGKAEREAGARLRAEIADMVATRPDLAETRLAEALAARGLRGEGLRLAVSGITTDAGAWTDLLLAEQGGADAPTAPARAAAVTFLAFVACGLVPLLPFALGAPDPLIVSVVLTASTFAAIGALKSRWSLARWWSSAGETLAIGGAAAVIAYAVGRMFEGM